MASSSGAMSPSPQASQGLSCVTITNILTRKKYFKNQILVQLRKGLGRRSSLQVSFSSIALAKNIMTLYIIYLVASYIIVIDNLKVYIGHLLN